MDESGHRENGRHKPEMHKAPQSQWLMQQPQSMKHIMSIMAERDAAIQERNMAVSEKKKAQEERDTAIMERDAAIQEKNEAMIDRDNALATIQYHEHSMDGDDSWPSGSQIARSVKHLHHPQHVHHASHVGEHSDAHPLNSVSWDSANPRKVKRAKEANPASSNKKTSKSKQKVKKGDDLNKLVYPKSEWKEMHDMDDDSESNKQESKPDWKGADLGLNQVAFDESTMPPPVCSCTGVYRQCYKWGNGGWQSSCCTTTMSMYPLPAVPNKRHARIGGRKMSGSVFNKLLSRLAGDGHDLSTPVDLKDHWAKHGTNRYITIR